MMTLKTRWADAAMCDHPLPEYPRPQMVRERWLNLNGMFDYAVTDAETAWPGAFDGQIRVPFAIESCLSGVCKKITAGDRLWYRKVFSLPADFAGRRVLLHFGAVDWECHVFVNGKEVAHHVGGYCPFSADITDTLHEGDNELVVKVYDPTDDGWQNRGKQASASHGFWYTSTSGPLHIRIYDGDAVVADCDIDADAAIPVPDAKLWSPESPFLYDFVLTFGEDSVKGYFAMRKFSIGEHEGFARLFLNNKPYFQRGLLDQGYWSDGGLTPPTDDAMIYDIQTMKDLGFNMLRKHIKVEPARWYYHCDRLGMIVWQDMISGGKALNLFHAGVLPNAQSFLSPLVYLSMKDNKYKLFHRDRIEWRTQFEAELFEMITCRASVPGCRLTKDGASLTPSASVTP